MCIWFILKPKFLFHNGRSLLSRAWVQLFKTEGLCFLSFVSTTLFCNSITVSNKKAYSVTCDPMPVATSEKQVGVYGELSVTKKDTNTTQEYTYSSLELFCSKCLKCLTVFVATLFCWPTPAEVKKKNIPK